MRRHFAAAAATLLLLAACGDSPTTPVTPAPGPTPPPSTPSEPATLPELPREFRGLWIATVANIDWPSRTGLSAAAAQAEFTAILDRAQATGLNALVLQVRAAGDALFPSTLEPWSRSLTGTQGTDPGWDPLAWALQQAHARGLELHAWFNPFRAGNLGDSLARSPLHFANRRPDLSRAYCTQLWFDPGEPDVRAHALAVIADVVQRYDIDAVHLDDYFYPYPDSRCSGLQFPDSASYARYRASGGQLARNDWRRDNVNQFVQALRPAVHTIRPTARVGISPFGIWRPGFPTGIVGLDSYASIFADSQLWFVNGWVDYFAPQLYWARSSVGQNFDALLDWWISRNTQRRHLWPGLGAYRVADGSASAFPATEIEAQVNAVRQRAPVNGGSTGTILYNTTVLMQNRDGLATRLGGASFASPAVVPATPWLGGSAPPAAAATAIGSGASATLRLTIPSDGARWWVARWWTGSQWALRQQAVSSNTMAWPTTSAGTLAAAVHVQLLGPTGMAGPVTRVTR